MKRAIRSAVLPTLIAVALGSLSLLLSTTNQLALATVLLGAVLGTQLTVLRRLLSEDPRDVISEVRAASPAVASCLQDILVETAGSLKSVERESEMLEKVLQAFSALLGTIQRVRSGQLEVEPDDTSVLIGWADRARVSIDGTALAAYSVKWSKTSRGQRFWASQIRALQRGVKIRRVFIYTSMTDELRELVALQSVAGVTCRVIHAGLLQAPFVHDMTIFDKRRLHEAFYGTDERPWRDKYSVANADLASSNAEFEILFDSADDIRCL